MNAIEVGAFSWARIQRLYDADAVVHWQRCEEEGLQCPQEVFTQLFHEEANNEDFAVIVRSIDWGRVSWELQEFSGERLGICASIAGISMRWKRRGIGRRSLASSMSATRWLVIGETPRVGSFRPLLLVVVF